MTLKEILKNASAEKWALPHFNISDLVTLRGLCEAARNLKSPMLIGTSEGERKFIGLRQAVAAVKVFAEEYNIPIFINADHSFSVESAKTAIDAGYDSVHIDLSKLPFEENLSKTKEVVKYARSKNPDISVEGEVGYLVTESSKIYKEAIEIPPESLTKPEETEKFVAETGVDRFAPAVGNLHGIAANAKKLDLERIGAIQKIVGDASLVLHGGSGTSDEDFKGAIFAGISNIHINTELRVAYSKSLRGFLTSHPEETAPYKFLFSAQEAIRMKAEEKILLFGSANRI